MPLVQTFMWGGGASLGAGYNCFATGILPACLTSAIWQPIAGATSVATLLVSRATATVIFSTSAGAQPGEMLAIFAHSVIA